MVVGEVACLIRGAFDCVGVRLCDRPRKASVVVVAAAAATVDWLPEIRLSKGPPLLLLLWLAVLVTTLEGVVDASDPNKSGVEEVLRGWCCVVS